MDLENLNLFKHSQTWLQKREQNIEKSMHYKAEYGTAEGVQNDDVSL